MQATSNGKLIQVGIGEKLGMLVQAMATFIAAFVIAFISQWKLTLIIIGMVPVLLIVVGGVAGLDAQIEADILKIHAEAGSYAETTLAGAISLMFLFIAIARALIRKPAVILLDETTSALDTESERVVQAALLDAATTGNRITVAVAHRLSTIREASRIFVFHEGLIIESGSHEHLVKQGGTYAKMCKAQKLDQGM